jgi:hypothetical protein
LARATTFFSIVDMLVHSCNFFFVKHLFFHLNMDCEIVGLGPTKSGYLLHVPSKRHHNMAEWIAALSHCMYMFVCISLPIITRGIEFNYTPRTKLCARISISNTSNKNHRRTEKERKKKGVAVHFNLTCSGKYS